MKGGAKMNADAADYSFAPEMFEYAVWGMFHTTAAGQYLAANTALARIYGYDSAGDLLIALRDIAEQLYVDPYRRTVFIEGMRTSGAISGFESQVYRRDGTIIWISESCREVRSVDGHMLYYEGSVEDISKRKQIEADLHAAKEQAEEANRAKIKFLALMGHELRTPLNAVIGFSQLMRDRSLGPLAPRYAEYADFINDSGTKLLSSINDVLELVALESRELVVENGPISVDRLFSSVVCEQAEKIRQKGLDVRHDVLSDHAALIADPRLMKKALKNLLSNAIRFTETGGRVTISARNTGSGGLSISVADTGCGMNETEIARACEPFSQAEALMTRRHEGMGIGLAIAKAAVELHQGFLFIRSELGVGTEVILELPRSRIRRNVVGNFAEFARSSIVSRPAEPSSRKFDPDPAK